MKYKIHPNSLINLTHRAKKGCIPWNKGEKVTINCTYCCSVFLVHPYRAKIAKFCSKACHGNHLSTLRAEKTSSWKGGLPKCPDCKITVSRNAGRCHACSRVYRKSNNLFRNQYGSYKGGYPNKLLNNTKRHVAKLGATGSHTLEQWIDLKTKYNNMCLCCKRSEPEITLSEDHILPLTKGGSNDISNIQPLCRSCNSRKYTKLVNYVPLADLFLNQSSPC